MSRVSSTRPADPKTAPRVKAPGHLARVAQLGCLVCNRRGCQCHHLLRPWDGTRGTGRRAGDHNAIPLCPMHHRQLHKRGDEDAFFEEVTGSPDTGRVCAKNLWELNRE